MYDASDRLLMVDDSVAGVITREWDGFDRLIEEDTPEGTISTLDNPGWRVRIDFAETELSDTVVPREEVNRSGND